MPSLFAMTVIKCSVLLLTYEWDAETRSDSGHTDNRPASYRGVHAKPIPFLASCKGAELELTSSSLLPCEFVDVSLWRQSRIFFRVRLHWMSVRLSHHYKTGFRRNSPRSNDSPPALAWYRQTGISSRRVAVHALVSRECERNMNTPMQRAISTATITEHGFR